MMFPTSDFSDGVVRSSFTDKTLKIYRIACEIFNITRSPDIVRSARLNFSELSLAINASLAI